MVRDPHLEVSKERIILTVDKQMAINSTLIISNGGKIPYDLDIIPSDSNIVTVDIIQNITQGEIKIIEIGYGDKIRESVYKKDFEIYLNTTIGIDKKIPVIFQDSFEILQIQKNLNTNSFNVTDNYVVTIELSNQSNKTAVYNFFESIHPWLELESNTSSCQYIPNERGIFCKERIGAMAT